MSDRFEALEDEGPIVGSGEINGCAWRLQAKEDEDGHSYYVQTAALEDQMAGGSGVGGGPVPTVEDGHLVTVLGGGRASDGRKGSAELFEIVGVVAAGVARVDVESGHDTFSTALVDQGGGHDRLFVGVYLGREPSAVVAISADDDVLERVDVEPYPRPPRRRLRDVLPFERSPIFGAVRPVRWTRHDAGVARLRVRRKRGR